MTTKTIDELETWWHKTNGTGTDACSKCTPNHVCSWHTERLADIEALITEAREDSYSECFRIIKEVNDKLFMYETIFGKIHYDYNGTDTVERFKQYQELEPERVKFGNWLEKQEAQLKENK